MAHKQVIVVRRDLKMPAGKMAAQVAHGSLGAYLLATKANQNIWSSSGSGKIIARTDSEEELRAIYEVAKDRGLPAVLICDAGRTCFKEPTLTVVGIGPCDERHFVGLTDHLPLY